MIGKILNALDRKYALGLLTGLIFGAVGIYVDFFRDTGPNVRFDVLSNATVVDLKENIGKIDIVYDSVSILTNKQTLSLITVKVANNGSSDILRTHYDSKTPLGLTVENGILLEKPSLIQASSHYLKDNLEISSPRNNSVNFGEVIFEKNEYYIVKLLVLHNNNVQPGIIPQGKVAGVREIEVVKSYLNKDSSTFFDKLIQGSFLVHIVRGICYLVILLVTILAIVYPISSISAYFATKRRKKKIQEYLHLTKLNPNPAEQLILDYYQDIGLFPIIRVLSRIEATNDKELFRTRLSEVPTSSGDFMNSTTLMGELVDISAVVKDGDKFTTTNDFLKFMKEFIAFAKVDDEDIRISPKA